MVSWIILHDESLLVKGIFHFCSTVSDYMDVNKAHGEKARRQLHKNATSHIEQILETTFHKIATVGSPTSNL